MDHKNQINDAYNKIRNGEKTKAVEILREVVRIDQKNETAWYLLAHAVHNYKQKVFCLEQVLKINPNNDKAKIHLEKIRNLNKDSESPQRNKIPSITSNFPKRKNLVLFTILGTLIGVGIISIVVIKLIGIDFQEGMQNISTNETVDQSTPTSHTIPTPHVIPTLSPKEGYCDNFNKSKEETTNYANGFIEFATYLTQKTGRIISTTSKDIVVTWEHELYYATSTGLGAEFWRNSSDLDYKEGYDNMLLLAKTVDESGTDLLISLNKVEVPTSIKYSHEKLIACYEQSAESIGSIIDFLEYDKDIGPSNELEYCLDFEPYFIDIDTYCKE